MGVLLVGTLVLAMAGLPVATPDNDEIDLSVPVNDPAGYFQGSRANFLADHVSRFNSANNTEVSVVFVDSLGEFTKVSEFSRSLFAADDSRVAGEDKRVMILVCIKPLTPAFRGQIEGNAQVNLYTYVQVGDDLANVLPESIRQSIVWEMRAQISAKNGVLNAVRGALQTVFQRINPQYKTDVATAPIPAAKKVGVKVRTLGLILGIVVIGILGDQLYGLYLRRRSLLQASPLGSLTPKQVFARYSKDHHSR